MELQRALAMGSLNFSMATVAHMIRLHDRNQSGSIDFDEFSSLHNFLTNMRASFQHFDKDRSGQLDLNEIHQAITHAGFQLDQHAFYATCKAFDPDRTGTLGEPEFIALTVFLQSARGIFDAFDTGRTNSHQPESGKGGCHRSGAHTNQDVFASKVVRNYDL
eukprot:scaffold3014_cov41-Prasinocladus_malaysianus.AAC.1